MQKSDSIARQYQFARIPAMKCPQYNHDINSNERLQHELLASSINTSINQQPVSEIPRALLGAPTGSSMMPRVHAPEEVAARDPCEINCGAPKSLVNTHVVL